MKAKEWIAAGLPNLSFDLLRGRNSAFSIGQEIELRRQKRAFILQPENNCHKTDFARQKPEGVFASLSIGNAYIGP